MRAVAGGRKGKRAPTLKGELTGMWEAELLVARSLSAIAEGEQQPRKARLLVLAAFARAHASRLLGRVSAMGRGPLPVEDGSTLDFASVVPVLRHMAERYAQLAEDSRNFADLSSAWVCELNRAECEDAIRELTGKGKAEK